jgi:hypothetical protein
MLHLPLLRFPDGRAYRSLETVTLPDVRTGQPAVEVSQANAGIISHDLLRLPEVRRELEALPVAELLAICRWGRAVSRSRPTAISPSSPRPPACR